MGKTAKRQNKKAAAQQAALAALKPRAKHTDRHAAAAAPAASSGVQRKTVSATSGGSGTSIGRVGRAVEAELVQEACVALDALLAECERGERSDAPPLDLCTRVLAMCQKAGKAKPALRLLQRMALCGMQTGPVQLRQAFFACCTRGMVGEALSLMQRRDESRGGRRLLGKDVLIRGCGMLPGGVDGDLGMVLLEGTLRSAAGGGWEGVPADAGQVRVYHHPPWTPPAPSSVDAETAGGGGARGAFPLMAAGGCPSADAASLAPKLYPPETEPFWFVCDDDGRRRPSDRNGLELWAPATPHTIQLAPGGLELESERHEVPSVPGAFAVTGVLTRRETAALRAAAHAVGWRRDAPDPDAPDRGRLDYCEMVLWPETAERLWSRVKMHMPPGAVGLNARLRFFRYGPDTVYRRHVDGSWPAAALTPEGEYLTDASDGKQRSRLTFLMYLSEGFLGGGTTFYTATPGHPGTVSARAVLPREGSVLCFPHGDAEDSPVHEGSAVAPGPGGARHKYIIRTDVLFDVTPGSATGAEGGGE